jgi:hypothetical protein
LSTIRIPSSVEFVHGFCFYRCKNLSVVTFGDESRLKYLAKNAFNDCSSLSPILTIPSETFIPK